MTDPVKTTGQTPAAPPTNVTSDNFAKFMQSFQGSSGNAFQYQPKSTEIADLTQTSQPDVTSWVNAAMQQLVGRNATAAEVAQYGSELLAAEKANQGQYNAQLSYSTSTGKPLQSVGQQLVAGVNPQDFLMNLIQGTGEAKEYKVATQYMDAMTQANQEYRGAYNG
jgi:hypothetical protein